MRRALSGLIFGASCLVIALALSGCSRKTDNSQPTDTTLAVTSPAPPPGTSISPELLDQIKKFLPPNVAAIAGTSAILLDATNLSDSIGWAWNPPTASPYSYHMMLVNAASGIVKQFDTPLDNYVIPAPVAANTWVLIPFLTDAVGAVFQTNVVPAPRGYQATYSSGGTIYTILITVVAR